MAHFYRPEFKRGIITPEDIYHERYAGQFKCEKCAQWWKSVHLLYGSQIFCPNCKARIYGFYRSSSYKSDVVYVDGQYRFKAEYKHREWTKSDSQFRLFCDV